MEERLLITGFDPFGGDSQNPAQLILEQLPDTVGPFRLKKCVLPTVFGEAARLALKAAEDFHPHVILCLGVAAGRKEVTPERIAVNIRDARIPDNAGNQPGGEPIDPQGDAAYFATVPVAAMTQAIREAGLPAAVSNSAGTFVCNDLMYTLLRRYHGSDTLVGFVHVPALPGQHEACLPLADTATAIRAAIASIIPH